MKNVTDEFAYIQGQRNWSPVLCNTTVYKWLYYCYVNWLLLHIEHLNNSSVPYLVIVIFSATLFLQQLNII